MQTHLLYSLYYIDYVYYTIRSFEMLYVFVMKIKKTIHDIFEM